MIYICNLIDMPGHCDVVRPSHLVSLVTTDEQPPTPAGLLVERHLRVEIHDIDAPLDGCVLPDGHHVRSLIEFLHGWEHSDAPLLVHCFAGISRSMAAALIALVIKAGGREAEAARHLRAVAPHAQPNRRMIALADEQLACAGRLIAARDAMGSGQLVPFGPLIRLPLLS